jgi:hypothetical protein
MKGLGLPLPPLTPWPVAPGPQSEPVLLYPRPSPFGAPVPAYPGATADASTKQQAAAEARDEFGAAAAAALLPVHASQVGDHHHRRRRHHTRTHTRTHARTHAHTGGRHPSPPHRLPSPPPSNFVHPPARRPHLTPSSADRHRGAGGLAGAPGCGGGRGRCLSTRQGRARDGLADGGLRSGGATDLGQRRRRQRRRAAAAAGGCAACVPAPAWAAIAAARGAARQHVPAQACRCVLCVVSPCRRRRRPALLCWEGGAAAPVPAPRPSAGLPPIIHGRALRGAGGAHAGRMAEERQTREAGGGGGGGGARGGLVQELLDAQCDPCGLNLI